MAYIAGSKAGGCGALTGCELIYNILLVVGILTLRFEVFSEKLNYYNMLELMTVIT